MLGGAPQAYCSGLNTLFTARMCSLFQYHMNETILFAAQYFSYRSTEGQSGFAHCLRRIGSLQQRKHLLAVLMRALLLPVGPTVELQWITLGEGQQTAYFLQKELCRVMETDQAMMDILGKVMPYKVCFLCGHAIRVTKSNLMINQAEPQDSTTSAVAFQSRMHSAGAIINAF